MINKRDDVLTVSGLNFYIKDLLNSNKNLNNVFVMGEVSNLVLYNKSGHIYFSLKDEKSSVKAVVFSSTATKLKFLPKNGLKVIVRGSVSVYETNGTYQIYVNYIEPAGIGSLNLAFEQLKLKLEKAGLFNLERKKNIPTYPKRVGLITSKTGAVLWDIKTTLEKRAPIIEIFLIPVKVQGIDASAEIISAIKIFNNLNNVDVLIIARGGGSIEDLWPFNSEDLALEIAKSKIPIISAVGHEMDYTICDFVSDKRAATPTASAQIVSKGYVDAKLKLKNYLYAINVVLKNKLIKQKCELENFKKILKLKRPSNVLKEKKQKLEIYKNKLSSAFFDNLNCYKNKLIKLETKLKSFNPQKIFNLGYALVLKNNCPLKSINNVNLKEKIKVRLKDGTLECTVIKITPIVKTLLEPSKNIY